MNPDLQKIYDNLQTQVDALVKDFWVKLKREADAERANTPQPAVANKPMNTMRNIQGKTLPWFQHGMRGFLRKLWHGDHPENPSWNAMQGESVRRMVSVKEYAEIKSGIREIFNEENSLFDDLSAQIMKLVTTHMQQAYDLGYQRVSSADTGSGTAAATLATDPTVNPVAGAVENPTAIPKRKNRTKIDPATPPTESGPITDPRAAAIAAAGGKVDELDPKPIENLDDAAAQIKTELANGRKEHVKEILKKVGVKLASNRRYRRGTEETFIRIMRNLSMNGATEDSDDWLDPMKYVKVFGLELNPNSIRPHITPVASKIADEEATKNAANDANSEGNPLDMESKIAVYRRLLKEKSDPVEWKRHKMFEQARLMPVRERIQFYAEQLKD